MPAARGAPIGVICGLRAEAAALAGRPDLIVRVTGARPEAARAAAARLAADGCRGLISFGTAGGLCPRLVPGTLVIADHVLLADGRALAADGNWRRRLIAALPAGLAGRSVTGRIAAAALPLFDPAAKAASHAAGGALAVDMESGGVAEAAAAAALPFLVVRAIADPADRAVPAWVMASVAADGGTRIAPVLARLVRRPADIVPLCRLAGDARRAIRTLSRVAALPALGDL